jgi:hypothetical protein
MAALAYRDDKILARNLLSRPFFCLTPAEPFFRPDRSSTAPSCRVAVKDGRAFRGHPKGLSLTAASTMARWRYRSGRRPCVAAEQVSSPRRSSRFRFPFPQCLQKRGNSNREVHRLSRFSDHQSACSCSQDWQTEMWFSAGYKAEVDALHQINGLVKAKRLGAPFKEVELIEIAPVTPAGFFNFFVERKRVYDLAFEEAAVAFAARGLRPAKVA